MESTDQTTDETTAESTIESTEQTDTPEPPLTIDPSEFVVQPTIVDSVQVLDYDGNPFTVMSGMSTYKMKEAYCAISYKEGCPYMRETIFNIPINNDYSTYEINYYCFKTPTGEDVVAISEYYHNVPHYNQVEQISFLLLFPSDAPQPSDDMIQTLSYGTTPSLQILQSLGAPEVVTNLSSGNWVGVSYISASETRYDLLIKINGGLDAAYYYDVDNNRIFYLPQITPQKSIIP